METPSFTFRLRRVRDLRERAEEHAREQLARELQLRMRGEALLREAMHAVDAARDTGSGIFRRAGASGADMLAAQAYLERAERDRREAALGRCRRRYGRHGRAAAATLYAAEITAAARKHGVGPALLAGLVKQESDFDPDAGSPAGAQGSRSSCPPPPRRWASRTSTIRSRRSRGGAKYLRRQLNRFGGDVARALAAYNAGPGAVERLGGVPPYAETQEYVRRVQANAAEFRATGSAGAASTARTAVLSTSPSSHGIV